MYIGSLIPLGAACCPLSSLLPAGVAFLPFVLMLTVSLNIRIRVLRNRHQLRRLLDLLLINLQNFRLFLHLGNFDVPEHLLDALIYFSERLANRATIALPTFAANGHTRSNEQRSVNRLDHFESGNHFRIAGQRVSAVDAMLG